MALIQCFLIAEPNMAQFKAAVLKAARRAAKLGMEQLSWERAPEFDMVLPGANPVPLLGVNLTGDVPDTSEWLIVGSIERLPDSTETLIRGLVPDNLRHEGTVCDHCHTNRNRNMAYVVRFGNSDIFRRVGKSCLNDFLQGESGEKLAKLFETLMELQEQLEQLRHCNSTGGSRETLYFTPQHVLEHAATAIRTFGWCSAAEADRTGAESTGCRVVGVCMMEPTPSAADQDLVANVIQWLLSTEVEESAKTSPYLHNLMAMTRAGSVPYYKVSLMASAIQAYTRAKKDKDEAKSSTFLGTVGDRLELTATVVRVVSLPPSEWGPRTLYLFQDTEGNKLTWTCSTYSAMRVGASYHLSGRVVKHVIYRDQMQTNLTRVTCLDFKLLDAVSSPKKLKKLLAQGLNPDIRNARMETPLHLAAESGLTESAKLLLDAGASLDLKSSGGQTPLELAVRFEHLDTALALLSAGASGLETLVSATPPEWTTSLQPYL